jgi:hypothetical protein
MLPVLISTLGIIVAAGAHGVLFAMPLFIGIEVKR